MNVENLKKKYAFCPIKRWFKIVARDPVEHRIKAH